MGVIKAAFKALYGLSDEALLSKEAP